MKISKGHWHYPLYALASPAPNIPQTRWTYVRRASLNTLGVLILLACAAVLAVVCIVATVIANLITIPLGFGLATTFFGKDFLQVPFRIRQRNLAHFLVPFWASGAIYVGVWFGLSIYPLTTVSVLVFAVLILNVFRAKKAWLDEPVEFIEA